MQSHLLSLLFAKFRHEQAELPAVFDGLIELRELLARHVDGVVLALRPVLEVVVGGGPAACEGLVHLAYLALHGVRNCGDCAEDLGAGTGRMRGFGSRVQLNTVEYGGSQPQSATFCINSATHPVRGCAANLPRRAEPEFGIIAA